MSQSWFVSKGGAILAKVLNEYVSHVVTCIFKEYPITLVSTPLKVEASVSGLKLGLFCRKCQELIGECLIFMSVIVTKYLVKNMYSVFRILCIPTVCFLFCGHRTLYSSDADTCKIYWLTLVK